MNTIPTITVAELQAKRDAGEHVELIDVRTPLEFREVHVDFARNVPLDRLDPAKFMQERNGSAGEPLYVICKSGNRARQACEKLRKAGHGNIVNVIGGTQAWDAAGLPVVRGKKAISLERQVRIAAGALVLIGALLAFFVNIHFVWLSAFVGAGLVFAGITDTCGMALMLARAPWNQVEEEKSAASPAQQPQKEQAACCG
jgi:rhodanese-related sulfurtransferase